MAILTENTWSRHSNPWSGWTRVLSMPILALGLYYHNYLILAATIVWLIINPIIFPKPKNINNWMSKGVLGEQIYFKKGRKIKKDLPSLLNVVNVPVFFMFLYFGWQQELVAMILAGLLTMAIKFWFIDRMVLLAEKEMKIKSD